MDLQTVFETNKYKRNQNVFLFMPKMLQLIAWTKHFKWRKLKKNSLESAQYYGGFFFIKRNENFITSCQNSYNSSPAIYFLGTIDLATLHLQNAIARSFTPYELFQIVYFREILTSVIAPYLTRCTCFFSFVILPGKQQGVQNRKSIRFRPVAPRCCFGSYPGN